MLSLQDFPSEILVPIFSWLPQPTLRAITLTCRRLGHIANPLLYESVDLWGSGDPNASFWSWSAQIPGLHRSRENLTTFVKTIQSVEYLRPLVKHVQVGWLSGSEEHVVNMQRCLEALRLLDLQSLHLEPPPSLQLDIPPGLAVTSLACSHQGQHGFDKRWYNGEVERLYQLFCIPSLETFSIGGWKYWGQRTCYGHTRPPWHPGDGKAHTSDVKHLAIDTWGSPGEHLQRILSWPKALKSCEIFMSPEDGLRYLGCGTLSTSELEYALLHQRSTLERLILNGEDSNSGETSPANSDSC